jgi:hypothetical protein
MKAPSTTGAPCASARTANALQATLRPLERHAAHLLGSRATPASTKAASTFHREDLPMSRISNAVLVCFAVVAAATQASAGGPLTSAKASEPKPMTKEATVATPADGAANGAATDSVATFGAPVGSSPALPLDALFGKPEKFSGKTVIVEGTVSEVCQNKGCWMTMQHDGKEMRVRFKDYAFFVPKDSAGKHARIEGVFKVENVPAAEARHYLEDAGKKEEAAKITEPVPSLTFMASGVELR